MKIRVRFPLKVGKTYYTREGNEVRICAVDGKYPDEILGVELQPDGWVARQWRGDGTSINYDYTWITHEEWEPADKELVWAWDSHKEFGRRLGFYDAKNNKLFNLGSGTRNGYHFSKYAPYEGEWPEWAKEAAKKLED